MKYAINPKWKSARKGYKAIHIWIASVMGKPSLCAHCGDNSDRRYHWANISGEYKKDITDWVRLCPPCHVKMDMGDKCRKGHDLTEDNTYYHPTGGRLCRICKSAYMKKYSIVNRESYLATLKRYKSEHKEYFAKYGKEWRDKHPDYMKDYYYSLAQQSSESTTGEKQ